MEEPNTVKSLKDYVDNSFKKIKEKATKYEMDKTYRSEDKTIKKYNPRDALKQGAKAIGKKVEREYSKIYAECNSLKEENERLKGKIADEERTGKNSFYIEVDDMAFDKLSGLAKVINEEYLKKHFKFSLGENASYKNLTKISTNNKRNTVKNMGNTKKSFINTYCVSIMEDCFKKGYPIKLVSQKLGKSEQTLRKWLAYSPTLAKCKDIWAGTLLEKAVNIEVSETLTNDKKRERLLKKAYKEYEEVDNENKMEEISDKMFEKMSLNAGGNFDANMKQIEGAEVEVEEEDGE